MHENYENPYKIVAYSIPIDTQPTIYMSASVGLTH